MSSFEVRAVLLRSGQWYEAAGGGEEGGIDGDVRWQTAATPGASEWVGGLAT